MNAFWRTYTILFLLGYYQVYAQHVDTYSGKALENEAINGNRIEARYNNPHGIAIDKNGNIYIADRFNHIIRKITSDGIVSTFAGSGEIGDADGTGTSASFYEPWDVEVDKDGNVYVADYRNNKIRKITPEGDVSTYAGTGDYGITNGPRQTATFGNPSSIAIVDNGVMYVADHNTHHIRLISLSGQVSSLAGSPYVSGDSDGIGNKASFNRLYGIKIGPDGFLYVADEHNHKIRKVSVTGSVTTIAGTGNVGSNDGKPLEASFNFPWDIEFDQQGNIYILDGFNYVIRKIDSNNNNEVATWVGTAGTTGARDGYGDEVSFNGATSATYYPKENCFYLADAYNHLIRKLTFGQVQPVLTASNDMICENQPLTLAVDPDTLALYEFYNGDTLIASSYSNSLEVNGLASGNILYAKVADKAGNIYETPTLSVHVNENPEVAFVYALLTGSDRQTATGAEVLFEVTTDTLPSYAWSFGDGGTSEDKNPMHVYDASGQYTVVATVTDSLGCTNNMSQTIILEEKDFVSGGIELLPDVFIPNTFSPNSDGNNDVFLVRGEIENLTLKIYTQWGGLIYETNSPEKGWDGTYQGEYLENGTYVYTANVKANEREGLFKGHINLIR